ncbi:hypothetical protein NDI49_27090 [Trichocoleus sp. ST-U3]
MKLSGRYSFGLSAGVSGFLLLILINAFSIPDSLKQASEKDTYRTQAELEKVKAESTKKAADAYSQNGIANFEQLIISNYTLSNQPPAIDWNHTVDPTKKTFIFDKNRLCIGYAIKGQFYFTKYYQGVCNG